MTTTEPDVVHKSERLYNIGVEAGWTSKIVPDISDPDNIIWTLYFSRKPELMKVVYTGNRLTEATYKLNGVITSPPHKAAVVKILLGQPDPEKLGVESARKHRRLPFDPDDIMPSRILDTLLGKRITWVSSLSTELMTERIEKARNEKSRYYRIIRTKDGRRYVEFTTNQGFRAVYLDAIVSVN